MKVTYDPAKRRWTQETRGIDFEDAGDVFSSMKLTQEDDRRDYGEIRFQTYGELRGRIVMIVWTPRKDSRHIISMRYCHEREAQRIRSGLS